MICCVILSLVIVLPAAILEALRRADERARARREWRWIKARYYQQAK